MKTTWRGITLVVLSVMFSTASCKSAEKPAEEPVIPIERVIWRDLDHPAIISREPVVPINPTTITGLHAHTAWEMEGAANQHDGLPEYMVIRWVGRGSITWKVNTAEPGDYEVALCYAANELAEGAQFDIVSADNRITGKIHKTNGLFEDLPILEERPIERGINPNFERVHLEGVLHLPAGISSITIRVTEPESGDVMDFRSMELTPVAAKESIAAENERAKKSRASTDWLVKAKYGVWAGVGRQPRHGPVKPYAEAVRDFDVDAFADMVEETGAGYVVFGVNSFYPKCPAPIASWEKVHPGWTTQRDLVGEVADALDKRGIKLMLHFAAHLIGRPDYMSEPAFLRRMINVRFPEEGFDEDMHVKILTEFGHRYGKKLAGHWFDGWDLIPEQHPSLSFERLFRAAKVGNPDRLISFNYWHFPDETPWQEYWNGEHWPLQKPPTGRYIEYSQGLGLQWQSLIMLSTPGMVSPGSRFYDEEKLISFVKSCTANDGVVTITLPTYQDGTIEEEYLKVMQALRRAVGK